MSQAITPTQISQNFTVAKILSILLVATEHYLYLPTLTLPPVFKLLWMPTSVGLFIFAFASGYFTSLRYLPPFSVKKFWQAKFNRLALRVLIINVFLFVLLLIKGRQNIFIEETPFAMMGLSSVLDWFHIAHKSPFGAGLWFFTILLIFYATYPLFAALSNTTFKAGCLAGITFLVTTVLNYKIFMPYSLWLVVFGFIFGTCMGKIRWKPNKIPSVIILTVCILALLISNFVFNFKTANYLLLVSISISTTALLLSVPLPQKMYDWLNPLSAFILEIYFIHTYLFITSPGLSPLLGYCLSMCLIIVVAKLLDYINVLLLSSSKKQTTT